MRFVQVHPFYSSGHLRQEPEMPGANAIAQVPECTLSRGLGSACDEVALAIGRSLLIRGHVAPPRSSTPSTVYKTRPSPSKSFKPAARI